MIRTPKVLRFRSSALVTTRGGLAANQNVKVAANYRLGGKYDAELVSLEMLEIQ